MRVFIGRECVCMYLGGYMLEESGLVIRVSVRVRVCLGKEGGDVYPLRYK